MPKAVLLVNLGTPDSPSVTDVGRYLRQFLNDHRVIDISPAGRFFLVNFIIIPFRVRKSASLYKAIWTERGSPLMFHSEDLAHSVGEALGPEYTVRLAMRYGNPSVESQVKLIEKDNPSEIIIVPLYPQYASSTTGSVMDAVFDSLKNRESIQHVRSINKFYDEPEFINAWKEISRRYDHDAYDRILFSYHGLPERQVLKASQERLNGACLSDGCCESVTEANLWCYRANCFHTTRLLADAFGLTKERYSVCFQSRLGSDEWLKPYAEDVIRKSAAEGIKKLLVYAPAFVADCLETIEEIGEEYRHLFKSLGGEDLTLVPSLNAEPAWTEGLASIIRKHSGNR